MSDIYAAPGSELTAPGPDADPRKPVVYAGFWLRVCAVIIDTIIVNVAVFIVAFAIGLGLGAAFSSDALGHIGQVIGLIGQWCYFAWFESSPSQATLGKKALGMKVTDEQGARISFARATGRYFGKFVSAMILCIGFIMVAFTDKKQGLHDKMASTLVVRTN
jgi:uncharacterized RDD family membrane protein YckC